MIIIVGYSLFYSLLEFTCGWESPVLSLLARFGRQFLLTCILQKAKKAQHVFDSKIDIHEVIAHLIFIFLDM